MGQHAPEQFVIDPTSWAQAQDTLALRELNAPIALCSTAGEVYAATAQARDLLSRSEVIECVPSPLPAELWDRLEAVTEGEAVEWRPPGGGPCLLGCTRYHCGAGYMVLMKEVSQKHAALVQRLHRQRLEATGRLVASVAHELRNAVANIVYSAELLELTGQSMPPEAIQETLTEMAAGSRQLRATVDSLLGYARVGPSEFVPVSVRDVLTRSQGFLRTVYRPGGHQLSVDVDSRAAVVRGNSLTIEQIFVNLLLNAAEAADGPLHVQVRSDLAPKPGATADATPHVRVRVWDNGPGISPRQRELVFQPFFSSREEGTGLGLTIAREAAERLGGTLVLEDCSPGACFAVYLPQADAADLQTSEEHTHSTPVRCTQEGA